MTITVLLISITITVVITAGIIFLQIFLSRLENKCFGLLIPVLSFLLSLVVVLSDRDTARFMNIESPSSSAFMFVVCNIPTVIFVLIFLICKERAKKAKRLEKMNIQDL